MNISQLSVKRPVTTAMFFMGIVILGLISWVKLPQELFPSISYPQITISTSYQNAAPEEIETLVTKVIEETVGTVNKVKRIKSISKEGLSLVIIDFKWNTNMDFAALNVREKIDLIKERLPHDCQEPIVMKYNPFELPIMNLSITANAIPSIELREITRRYVKDALEKIEGVANAAITGGDVKEIIAEIDQARLQASQISIVAVIDSLKTSNLNYPAGAIKESSYEYLIRTVGEFETIEEIKETPTALELPEEEQKKRIGEEKKEKERRLVYLKDIAKIKKSVKEKTSISRYNGKNNISLVIRKQSGTNTLKIAEKIRREIRKLLKEKLAGREIDIRITYDQSTFIKESINSLRNAAIQGGILAFFVLLFFLKDTLSSLTITLSIPISLMATICLMYFAKINLNMMSLGGLVLGIGMLVDNSIVVIENIFRHRQTNKELKQACGEGANEVFAPILGSTLTTVAVFLPFAFVIGLAGQIFKQLSFTIALSLLISILVAISLVPMAISLGKNKRKPAGQALKPKKSKKFTIFLSSLLNPTGITILIFAAFALFILSFILLTGHEKRFLPELDQRQFIIKAELAPGTRLKITDTMVKKIEKLLFGLPEVKEVTVNIGSGEEKTGTEETALKTLGSHQAQIMINLKKLSKKGGITHSTKKIIGILKERIEKDKQLKNVQIGYMAQESSLGQALEETSPIVIEIKGPDLSKLAEIGSQIKKEMKEIPGLYSVKTSLIPPTPETKIKVMKDKASLYGLSVRDIAITAQAALKGYVATQFKMKNEEKDIDIRVRLRSQDRANIKNLKRLLIRSPLRMMVPLSEVAYLVKGTGPTEIQRIDQQRTILVTANILDRPLKEILTATGKVIEKASKRIPDIDNYSVEIAGEQKKMQESFRSLTFALIFAIILVYMIMASEFESLWQPFIIMFTVPLSLIGVAFILILTKTPLSVVAYLGIIILGGITVNNGIVLIDFINNLKKQGYAIKEAVIQGTSTRLRPILMTSLTTILGMLPLSLAIGEGSELRAPMAKTVIGGLLSSTFLTLIIIPAFYLGADKTITKLKAIFIPLKVKEEPEKIEEIEQESLKEKLAQPEEIKKIILSSPSKEEEREKIPQPSQTKKHTNFRQKQLLEKLKISGRITRVEYAKITGISIPTASRDLKDLVNKNLIKGKGPIGPGRYYVLIDTEENEG